MLPSLFVGVFCCCSLFGLICVGFWFVFFLFNYFHFLHILFGKENGQFHIWHFQPWFCSRSVGAAAVKAVLQGLGLTALLHKECILLLLLEAVFIVWPVTGQTAISFAVCSRCVWVRSELCLAACSIWSHLPGGQVSSTHRGCWRCCGLCLLSCSFPMPSTVLRKGAAQCNTHNGLFTPRDLCLFHFLFYPIFAKNILMNV